MRILFIGNKNIQNDAILEIINNEGNFEITQVLSVDVEEHAVEPNPHSYEVALADLNSFPYGPEVSIKLIKSTNLADRIVALHSYFGEKLIEPIKDAGADFCFSVDSSSEDLLEIFQKAGVK